MEHAHRHLWQWLASLLAACLLLIDLQLELGVAAAVPYIAVIWLAYVSGGKDYVWTMAIAVSLLTLVGLGFSPSGGDLWKVLTNRLFGMFAIWATAIACLRLIDKQKELEAANRRAIEADRQHEDDNRKTRALANILEDLKIEQQKVLEVTNELSFPPRDVNVADIRVRLSEFSLADMIRCSGAIRHLSRGHPTEADYSAALVKFLYHAFCGSKNESEFALVRLYRSRQFDQLSESAAHALKSILPDPDGDTICLTLEASQGDQQEWNDPASSRGHQAIPLTDLGGVQQSALVSQMLHQLGVKTSFTSIAARQHEMSPQETGVFHVPNALGSPYVLDQEEFVKPFGIQSVVGIGGRLGDDELFVLLGFSKSPISAETVHLLAHLSHSARIGLTTFVKAPQIAVAKIRAVEGLLGSLEEIVVDQETRLRATMKTLEAANQDLTKVNEELEQFAYVASHDLQEPLRKISSYADLLLEECGEQISEDGHEFVKIIVKGSNRLKTLVSDLLTFSRVTTRGQELAPVDTDDCLRTALDNLEMQIQESDAQVTSQPLPPVMADKSQLIMVFQNLIGNGLKYRKDKTPKIHIGGRNLGSEFEFSVQDNGIGIEPQYFEQIFEIFKRLHNQQEFSGTGIGLAICKRTIERFGGRIWLESSPDRGSTFYFTIPKAT